MMQINFKKVKSRKALFVIVISIILLINLIFYTRLNYLLFADVGLPILKFSSLSNLFFVWNNYNYSGIVTNITSPVGILIEAFYLIVLNLFGIRLGPTIIIWINEVVGAVGMFFLVFEMAREINNKIAYVGALISALLFMGTFDTELNYVALPAVLLPYVFLLFFIFIKSEHTIINKRGRRLLYGSLLAIGLSGEYILAGNSFFIPVFLMVIIFFFISTFLFFNASEYRKVLSFLSIVIIIALLISLPFLVSTYNLIQNQRAEYSSQAQRNINGFSNVNLPIFFAFASYVAISGPVYNNAVLSMPIRGELPLLVSLFILAFGGIFLNFKPKYSYFALAIVISYLIFLPIATGASFPLSDIAKPISNLPYLFEIGVWHSYPIFLFLFFVGFGYAITNIINLLLKNRPYLVGFILLLSLLIFSYIYIFDYLPITQVNYSGALPKIVHPYEPANYFEMQNVTSRMIFPNKIPSYVLQTAGYINSQDNNGFAVGSLPSVGLSTWQITNWYWGPSIYASLINAPLYDGGYANTDEFFATLSQDYYYNLATEIDTEKVTNSSISNMFGIFGIKYIILQLDTLHRNQTILAPIWNKTVLESNLAKANKITEISNYGNAIVFKNINADPLVYSSNIKNIGYANGSQIAEAIQNPTFNISNTVVYSTWSKNIMSVFQINTTDLYNPTNGISPIEIPLFMQPKITFVQNSPTKITVRISNATTPYYLVFRETYDPHWAAFYSNGTMVNQSRHIQVNGFANAWYMNKTGNYTVTLYYTMQTYTWISWAMSLIALGATVSIGVYGWKESRKHSKLRYKPVGA